MKLFGLLYFCVTIELHYLVFCGLVTQISTVILKC